MSPAEDGRLLRATELTKDAYAELVDDGRVFVLPLGILEEHGPHLPLGTDGFQVEAVLEEACQATGAVLLPTLWYGNCVSTQPFPGSISLSFDTVRTVVGEILDELDRHGVAKVAVVSGHAGGGHMRAAKLAARDVLDAGAEMRIAVLSEWDLIFAMDHDVLAEHGVPPFDGHAGALETARILDLRPELVVKGKVPGAHELEEEAFIVPQDPAGGWPDGYGGDPSVATASLGKVLHAEAVDGLVEVFQRL